MIYKNITIVLFFIISFFFTFTYANADNKETILGNISSLETKIKNMQTNQTTSLENKVSNLTKTFDSTFTQSGFSVTTLNYMVSLGKINSNFKADLLVELSNLRNEINRLVQNEQNALTSLKDKITFESTINDVKFTSYSAELKKIEDNYENDNTTLTEKINLLQTKYLAYIETSKKDLQTAIDSNQTILNQLKDFSTQYDTLYTLYNDFEKNYKVFNDSYLAYAADLTVFSENKQKEYVELLKKELEKLRDVNIENNVALQGYKPDIDRFISILLENFENSLNLKISDSYGVIYSNTDVDNLISRFNTAKNRYYDGDGNLKAPEVVSSTGGIEEIKFITEKLGYINTKIKDLLGTGSTSQSLDNIKIRLENEMVRYYNENYKKYREDLILKLKEKLNIVSLETKNILLVADTIDLKYSILSDKLKKSNDINFIKAEISKFNTDLGKKYSYLNSPELNRKIRKMGQNLNIYEVAREIEIGKLSKYSTENFSSRLKQILEEMKTKFPNTYQNKLSKLVQKIDVILISPMSDKNKFVLLSVKGEILKFIKE